jgi:hypothetical protein
MKENNIIKSFCRSPGGIKGEGEVMKGRRVERKFFSRLKASIPCVPTNSHELYNIRHFDVVAAGTVHLKKSSVGPKGLIGPPCHGAPLVAEGQRSES